jgi:hypothetical protein
VGATFSRVKNWTTEVLSNTDLNTEIDNILNNLGPSGVDDYSTNSTQMRLETNPGSSGSESLATSMAGEIERLRYVIKRMIGSSVSYWYEAPSSTLTDLVAAIGTGLPTYRIVSGRTTGNSSQLCALIPSGTTASVTLTASVTPLIYYVAGTQYSITANVTLTGLSLAGAVANNTCAVNNTAATGQQWTKFIGMYGTQIDVDGMQATMALSLGKVVGLKSGNEYILGYLNSTSAITDCWRGAMFNQSASNVTAAGISDNASLQLLRLAWIFANTSSSLAVTYANPTISAEQPTGPFTGDYWFDLATTAWKTYNSTTWVAANATLIGLTMQDTVACVAARTFDSYKAMSELNTLNLERASNTQVQATNQGAEVSVFGTTNRFQVSRPIWDITTHLESGMTESVSYTYFTYMKENGTPVVSDRNPLMRRDLQGLYHPGETWRCLGQVYNNASTNFEAPVRSFRDVPSATVLMGDPRGINGSAAESTYVNSNLEGYFPNNFRDVAADSENFTVGQGVYQPNSTVALTSGVWKLSGVLQFNWTGTAAAAAVLKGIISDTPNSTVSGADTLNIGNFMNIAIGSHTSNDHYMFVPYRIVSVTAAQSYYLKGTIGNTVGASYAIKSRLLAERMDSLIGQPT